MTTKSPSSFQPRRTYRLHEAPPCPPRPQRTGADGKQGNLKVVSELTLVMPRGVPSLNVSGNPASVSESGPSNLLLSNLSRRPHRCLEHLNPLKCSRNDVRSPPRLTGSVNVGVAEVFSQFCLVVSFREKAIARDDETFADNLAYDHLPRSSDGPCLTLCQQVMSGRVAWSTNIVNGENANNPGSFAPPSTWKGLRLALLDILMPGNSIEECAIN